MKVAGREVSSPPKRSDGINSNLDAGDIRLGAVIRVGGLDFVLDQVEGREITTVDILPMFCCSQVVSHGHSFIGRCLLIAVEVIAALLLQVYV